MKQFFTIIALFFSLHIFADSWTQESNFGGTARHAATGFYLSGKAYIGTGGTFSIRKKDFWQWDPTTNVWTQKADLAVAQGRSGAVAFAITKFGYISTGFDNSVKKDLWQYDPTANTWTQKTDLGGVGRHFAAAFELGGYGYIGTGVGAGNLNDFWRYDPSSNSWTQEANFGGIARSSAVGFSLDGYGYIGIGFGTSNALSDFWQYDPAANTWTQKANFGGGIRSDAVGFGLCDKGYVATGVSNSVDKNELWQYDPATNAWTQKTNFPGSGREDAVGFSDGTTYGYVGTGTNVFSEFGDFYRYTPDCVVLPIELTSFTAQAVGQAIELNWTTESEINNDFFTVEKSLDGIHFETLTVVKGAGNSSSSLAYSTMDEHPFTGLNYYRLMQTDNDGKSSYSNTVSCVADGNNMMRILSVFPNPVQSEGTVILDLSEEDAVTVSVYSPNGALLSEKTMLVNDGIQQLNFSVDALNPGVYLLRLKCEYGDYAQKLMKF